MPPSSGAVTVRAIRSGDLEQVVALDALVTGIEKASYWERVYRRYGRAPAAEQRWLLVAVAGTQVVGFVIGEVRDWEFGSAPCGWLFMIAIDPRVRQAGIGTRLLEALCDAMRGAGVRQLRTMVAHENTLVLSFFRSHGMMAAPIIPMEMELLPHRAVRGARP